MVRDVVKVVSMAMIYAGATGIIKWAAWHLSTWNGPSTFVLGVRTRYLYTSFLSDNKDFRLPCVGERYVVCVSYPKYECKIIFWSDILVKATLGGGYTVAGIKFPSILL